MVGTGSILQGRDTPTYDHSGEQGVRQVGFGGVDDWSYFGSPVVVSKFIQREKSARKEFNRLGVEGTLLRERFRVPGIISAVGCRGERVSGGLPTRGTTEV